MLPLLKSITLLNGNIMFTAALAWLIENYLLIGSGYAGVVTAASVIAKFTKNETASKAIATIQTVVDAVAMSSAPTRFIKHVNGRRTHA